MKNYLYTINIKFTTIYTDKIWLNESSRLKGYMWFKVYLSIAAYHIPLLQVNAKIYAFNNKLCMAGKSQAFLWAIFDS